MQTHVHTRARMHVCTYMHTHASAHARVHTHALTRQVKGVILTHAHQHKCVCVCDMPHCRHNPVCVCVCDMYATLRVQSPPPPSLRMHRARGRGKQLSYSWSLTLGRSGKSRGKQLEPNPGSCLESPAWRFRSGSRLGRRTPRTGALPVHDLDGMGREACCRQDIAYLVSWRRVTPV